ncbi:pilus assembly protein TadG-related protein [Bradyrhizobium prioriisuperbiae]|uniref:pilus assembly protein TadG-related protein n=1 Tax=Bradyrhizobium prioriisuperbiae TaxID=2854389 RepID=UPI0028E98046|nr:pilus assembly protein TadG-related protein [Bradyrhizobium prioritasuperba]
MSITFFIKPGSRAARAVGRATNRLHRFRHDRRGNISLLFGLTLLPLVCMVGSAIDYSLATAAKVRLDSAADAAVLAAVNRSALTISASAAQATAANMFDVQSDIAWVTSKNATVSVNDSATGRTATVGYSAEIQTQMMKLAGFSTITLAGSSTAASALPTYIDFHLLLDNTPSMGVAATPTDVATMIANTSDKCAFACHDLSNSNDYYKLAKRLGVTMRIDVVRQATQSLMDTAAAAAVVPEQFRMAIYTFGSSCNGTTLTTITALTASLSSAKTAANAIDLMTVPYQNYNSDQCTDYDNVLAAMNNAIATPGSGAVSSPQKFLFFVSDGVADAYYPTTCTKRTTGGRCQEPLTVAACTAMKRRGIQIAVLYTTYLPLPTNAWYNTWIAPFSSEIATNMQSCASPGFYFEVSPTQGIADAMTKLFQKAVTQARLTN